MRPMLHRETFLGFIHLGITLKRMWMGERGEKTGRWLTKQYIQADDNFSQLSLRQGHHDWKCRCWKLSLYCIRSFCVPIFVSYILIDVFKNGRYIEVAPRIQQKAPGAPSPPGMIVAGKRRSAPGQSPRTQRGTLVFPQ